MIENQWLEACTLDTPQTKVAQSNVVMQVIRAHLTTLMSSVHVVVARVGE